MNTHSEEISKYFIGKPVLRAYLFGSEARNESDENSDIDILVELDYSKHIGLEFVTMQLELQKLLNKKVDLISAKAISKFLKPYIDKEKILIYER